ncbi:hypothetical protein TST_0658 [Thermosulfidibacter takaii ABI70S6]|uniref:Enoyl-CoA hydratase n=2 Tax=Thermosulfidibacter takaii TaxID=412593 RepID=A0A0S3QT01_THET7|nr:hypothetical protein TST_0658 [Thermosulfidibacter takaii ABI70S6]
MTIQKRNDDCMKMLGEGVLQATLPAVAFKEISGLLCSLLDKCDCEKTRILWFNFDGEYQWNIDSDFQELKGLIGLAMQLENISCLTIATVNGKLWDSAVEFLALMDLAFATEKSDFAITKDFVPVFGGIQRFVRTCGMSIAKELFLAGQITANRLYASGFLNGVFRSAEEMLSNVQGVCEGIISRSFTAVAMTKRILETTWDVSLEAGLAMEREMFGYAFTTDDRKEGMKAFFEKRSPNFKRRGCHEL